MMIVVVSGVERFRVASTRDQAGARVNQQWVMVAVSLFMRRRNLVLT